MFARTVQKKEVKLMKVNDNVIRGIFESQRKRRWNVKKCWPVKVIGNLFSFTAIEELKTQLIIFNTNLQLLQGQVNILKDKVKDLDERIDITHNFKEERRGKL